MTAVLPLTGMDLLEWLALGRVARGGVLHYQSRFLQGGQRIPVDLEDALDKLSANELILLASPDEYNGRYAYLSPTGRERFAALTRGASQR